MATSNAFAGAIISSSSPKIGFISTTALADADHVLTAAEVLGGMLTGTPTTAIRTLTLPTGAVLFAALPPDFAVGDAVSFTLQNLSAASAITSWLLALPVSGITTVLAAAGLLVNGSVDGGAAASNQGCATFRLVYTATTPAFVLHRAS